MLKIRKWLGTNTSNLIINISYWVLILTITHNFIFLLGQRTYYSPKKQLNINALMCT